MLDFGIAKILDVDEPAAPGAATVTSTGEGVLIGTTSYMSPEQARGAEVTRRSDVWAFGAILFEMLTGKRAFTGRRSPMCLPRSCRAARLECAASVERRRHRAAVRRCLERDPKARLHDIGDARLEIEDAERAFRDEGPIHTGPQRRTVARHVWSRRAILGWAAVTFAVAALALASISRLRGAKTLDKKFVCRCAAIRIASSACRPSRPMAATWCSPPFPKRGDGAALAAASAASGSHRASGDLGASYPFWSADGRSWRSSPTASETDGVPWRYPSWFARPAGRGGLWLEDDSIVFAPVLAR